MKADVIKEVGKDLPSFGFGYSVKLQFHKRIISCYERIKCDVVFGNLIHISLISALNFQKLEQSVL